MALVKCSNTSITGPDQVPYGVWKGIHSINTKIILILVKDMWVWGIHPLMPKESTGVILPNATRMIIQTVQALE